MKTLLQACFAVSTLAAAYCALLGVFYVWQGQGLHPVIAALVGAFCGLAACFFAGLLHGLSKFG